MSQYKDIAVGSTVYFWFAANTTAGSAGDGSTPLYDVRKAGDISSGAPTASGTPTLLAHANYTDGLHEIAIDTTGYTTGAEYAVFCTLTISSQNPAGFVGSFVVRAANSTLYEVAKGANDIVSHGTYGNSALNADLDSILAESQSHPTLAEIEASALAKEATVSSRLAASAYTAPDNAGIAAIKAKTDTIAWADITDIKDEALGKWVLDPTAKTLTLYRADGVTVLKTFNLTDTQSAIPAFIGRTPV